MERDGHPIGNMDLMIAASAIASGSTLVTNNERHFRAVPGLAFVNWTKEEK
jgi:tRNA(fMet)-specific endonuclease VapC